MKSLKPTLVALLVLSLFSVIFFQIEVKAEPKTIVVPDDYSTIQEAVDNAAEGYRIFVRKGTYYGSVFINKSLSLVGEDSETTVIVGDDYNLNGTVILIRHDNVNFTDFTVKTLERTSSRRGIHLLHSRYCNISGNIFTNCYNGIWLYSASQNTINRNTLIDNIYGVKIDLSDTNTFFDNLILDCSYGFQLTSSGKNTFRNNEIANCNHSFEDSRYETIFFFNDIDSSNFIDDKPMIYWINRSNETVPSNTEYVTLVNCTEITVQGFESNNTYKEILLIYTNNSKILNTNALIHLRFSSGNNIIHNAGNILLENSSFNTITKNTMIHNNAKIQVTYSSSNNVISENIIVNGNGISLEHFSNNNLIANNSVMYNHQGMYITTSSYNTLKNNSLIDNNFQFFVSSTINSSSNFINYVDSSNTINGKPIYYWTNKQDLTIPTDAGYVVLVNCTNSKVQNLNLSNGQGLLLIWTTNSMITQNNLTNGHGIHLVYSSNNTVSENSITNNNYGIMISESSDNNVVNNNLTNNMVGGIHLRECKSMNIIGNKITHNNPNGIWLIDNTYNNSVLENHIEYNSIGILVEDSSENLIVRNTIRRNREWGIQLIAGQRNNSIYHNLFIDNRMWNDGIQVSIPGIDETGEWKPGHANLWDDGEYGNYWSDYLSRYHNAMEIDNLGVGNIPYHINPNNIDNHPLMEPIIIPEFPLWTILPISIVSTLALMVLRIRLEKKGKK